MSLKPIEPAPDRIEPRAPSEAPALPPLREQPGGSSPEYGCPPDPSDTPSKSPREQPSPDPDA